MLITLIYTLMQNKKSIFQECRVHNLVGLQLVLDISVAGYCSRAKRPALSFQYRDGGRHQTQSRSRKLFLRLLFPRYISDLQTET